MSDRALVDKLPGDLGLSSPVALCGYLHKLKSAGFVIFGGAWTKRWYEVKNHCSNPNDINTTNYVLLYYSSQPINDSTRPKDTIELCDITDIRPFNQSTESPYCMLLETSYRTYVLKSTSQLQIDVWMNNLIIYVQLTKYYKNIRHCINKNMPLQQPLPISYTYNYSSSDANSVNNLSVSGAGIISTDTDTDILRTHSSDTCVPSERYLQHLRRCAESQPVLSRDASYTYNTISASPSPINPTSASPLPIPIDQEDSISAVVPIIQSGGSKRHSSTSNNGAVTGWIKEIELDQFNDARMLNDLPLSQLHVSTTSTAVPRFSSSSMNNDTIQLSSDDEDESDENNTRNSVNRSLPYNASILTRTMSQPNKLKSVISSHHKKQQSLVPQPPLCASIPRPPLSKPSSAANRGAYIRHRQKSMTDNTNN